MKRIILSIITLSFLSFGFLYAQSAEPVQENTASGAADLRKTEGTSSVKFKMKDMDENKVKILNEIAEEQEHVVSITTDLKKGTYTVVMDEPGLSKEKVEGFISSLIWHKENPATEE